MAATNLAICPVTTTTTDNNKTYRKIFKVIVIGDVNVGKTSLTYRFCEGAFLDAEATIGVDIRNRNLVIDGEEITLQLWDTAGQEKFRTSMVRHYYRNTHAIVLVYDVTNASSFDSLKRWVDECDQNCPHGVPRILVGNKCDGVAAVTTQAAQRFADQHNMPLFETSARLDSHYDNVEAIFLTLAYKLKNRGPLLPVGPSIMAVNLGQVSENIISTTARSWCC